MSNTIIVENENMTVECHTDKGIIHHTIHKPTNGQIFRDALEAGEVYFKDHGLSKWLSDDRKNSAILPEDVDWNLNIWSPRMIEAGWKYWALVVPKELAAAGVLTDVVQDNYALGLRTMVFTNVEEAIDWLDQQE